MFVAWLVRRNANNVARWCVERGISESDIQNLKEQSVDGSLLLQVISGGNLEDDLQVSREASDALNYAGLHDDFSLPLLPATYPDGSHVSERGYSYSPCIPTK